jgi:hypothetical protein
MPTGRCEVYPHEVEGENPKQGGESDDEEQEKPKIRTTKF